MTTKESIEKAIKTVEFDIKTSCMINDREYLEGYHKLKKKLEEAIDIIKKYDLI